MSQCVVTCLYGADVAPEYSGLPREPERRLQRVQACGSCAHYLGGDGPYDQERLAPIMLLNAELATCGDHCLAGSCRAPGTTMGCGGCCYCLGGCQADWERAESAPFVWEGDQA